MKYTEAQRAAIEAEANTLVVAGAGTGKTRTLIERCLRLLFGSRQISLDRLLVVTFTEAAAAEMRHRLRTAIEARAEEPGMATPCALHLARLDSAQISTLHSFCYRLVREHFGELGTDPAAVVLTEEQSAVLAAETLEELFDEHYRRAHAWSEDVHRLLRNDHHGWDRALGELVLRLHHYIQTRPHPEQWLNDQAARWSDTISPWPEHLNDLLNEWRARWLPALEAAPLDNSGIACAARLVRDAHGARLLSLPAALVELDQAKTTWPRGKKGLWRDPFEKFFEDAKLLASFTPAALQEDWLWAQPSIQTLLRLTGQFAQKFGEAKRARAALDFHDLEQLALQLLCEPNGEDATPLARHWQKRFDAVFVDEFQDINPAQDLILRCVSPPSGVGERFLVGDIKQSIYGFRQADPRIFARYLALPDSAGWNKVHLSDNFRSRASILGFVNGLFERIMRADIGGVEYNAGSALRFGNAEGRAQLGAPIDALPAVEFHLRIKSEADQAADDETEDTGAFSETEDAEWEARLAARRLRALHGTPFFDEPSQRERPLEWSDMAVLLRAAGPKAETWAKAFDAFGIPLSLKRDVFYATEEIRDLINLLTILDNPIQDIPLLGVLRSPFAGFKAAELAEVRMALLKVPFWLALTGFHERHSGHPVWAKVDAFLEQFQRWRNLHRTASIRERLEVVLADSGYGEWLLGRPRGRQRYANVGKFLDVARDFDRLRGENLYRFLRHLEQVQEAAGDIEPAAASGIDAVRLMTVHQSKGLEFPLVLIADLGKRWNNRDLSRPLLLDDELGLCPTIKPPGGVQRYQSLVHWAAQSRRRLDSLGEEMRILYVALTRARHRLVLTATATEKTMEQWAELAGAADSPDCVTKSTSWLGWLGSHFARIQPGWNADEEAIHPGWSHTIYRNLQQLIPPASASNISTTPNRGTRIVPGSVEFAFQFKYPHTAATRQAAKTSVTAQRRARETDEDSAVPGFPSPPRPARLASTPSGRPGASAHDSRERGEATHAFLEHIDLRRACDLADLQAQAASLAKLGLISSNKPSLINLSAIAAFWDSAVGRLLRDHHAQIRREMPFTVRLPVDTMQRSGALATASFPATTERQTSSTDGEWVVLQGVADLVVLGKDETWLLDYKTDDIPADQLELRVTLHRPQLELYRAALQAIFRRPVTHAWLHFLGPNRTFEV